MSSEPQISFNPSTNHNSTNTTTTPNPLTHSQSTRRRKNTKPDLGFRASPTAQIFNPEDTPSPQNIQFAIKGSNENMGEDRSEKSIYTIKPNKPDKPDKRTVNIVSTIMIWLKNVNKIRSTQLCKAFYIWKFLKSNHSTGLHTSTTINTLSTPINSENNQEETYPKHEFNKNYLLLFTENEKLREQINEYKRTTNKSEKFLRKITFKTIVLSFIRKKTFNKLRYYYDLWLNQTKIMYMLEKTKHHQLELTIGLQQVESERYHIRQTEEMNNKLQILLTSTIYFYKWKVKTMQQQWKQHQQQHIHEQQLIYQELQRMKHTIEYANQQEKHLFMMSMHRGQQMNTNLSIVQQQLSELIEFKRLQQSSQHKSTAFDAFFQHYKATIPSLLHHPSIFTMMNDDSTVGTSSNVRKTPSRDGNNLESRRTPESSRRSTHRKHHTNNSNNNLNNTPNNNTTTNTITSPNTNTNININTTTSTINNNNNHNSSELSN